MKKGVFWIMVLLSMRAFAVQQTPTVVLARAIAKAEGYGVRSAVPTRYNNPGDIRAMPGTHYPGQIGLSAQRYVIFRTKADGWAALYALVDKILSNQSAHYNTSMTFRQLARRYATSPTWVKNVTHNLGTTPSTTIAEYFDLPPVLVVHNNPHALDGIF